MTDIKIVFSDIDGTLVHYDQEIGPDDDIIRLPTSSTGLKALISAKTLGKCQELRRKGVFLVLVSGGRTTTIFDRLPFLPLADAYCSEVGGRIFYPVKEPTREGDLVITPHPYTNAREEDLEPFSLKEDLEWRARMEEFVGKEGYQGVEPWDYKSGTNITAFERKGALWDLAQSFLNDGCVIDAKGYASSFRVSRSKNKSMSNETFQAMLDMKCPDGLDKSVNLGSIDFYPKMSGKRNCCFYLAQRFLQSTDEEVLSKHAVCMCDDDNDLEMAHACKHAYLPSIASESMAQAAEKSKDKFTLTEQGTVAKTAATEAAIDILLGIVTYGKWQNTTQNE
eukprot:CAMPEP_0118682626 /NCGR_PEP_ID=MMETSP0800-20121206/5584_1 /TAXON_ID=210618 ORGANISM="Striatella unipunctata, Strain CCMP2910" /NCGR_SAMPLE_ID=MMETSP0800 /ASSEMBLY_ACC=CAM_ASM_000638 /LENGTH=336 /DNA_ID=CAMNT_0006579025 /DNA_START=155 /DNA_END=1165 /DNA_ORIENTATION=-